ncbi:unnamed protein product [Linum tenue]|uniref:Peptidase S1 domain-containing protein n=1 Tax=Linum tenue TaxID=586396 RepID=A0AAV0LF08_9ROSI|nr:unnamed protein product [Linum tenue]
MVTCVAADGEHDDKVGVLRKPTQSRDGFSICLSGWGRDDGEKILPSAL